MSNDELLKRLRRMTKEERERFMDDRPKYTPHIDKYPYDWNAGAGRAVFNITRELKKEE